MSTLDVISLLGGGAVALAAVVYALYSCHSLASTIAGQAALIIGLGSKLGDSERNRLSVQDERDKLQSRADEATAELALTKSQLASTQAALVAAQKANVDAAAESVRSAPDPNARLDELLASSDRSNVSDASHAPAADGAGQRPAVSTP